MRKLLIYIFALLSLPVVAQSDKDHNFTVAKNLEVFNAIYKNLDLLYVDKLPADTVIGNAVDAMLESLDPYTEFYPQAKGKDLKMLMTGKYAGVGALIRYSPKYKNVFIDEPYENMPAANAGLRKGDLILSIDDLSMEGKTTQFVSDHLRGDAGTTFMIKIRRPSTGKIMKLKITRGAIKMPAVPYYGLLDSGIGYINLNQFTEDCSKDFRRAFVEMKKNGMQKLIVDLRNNGGGLESEAVNIVNLFVPKDVTIVSNHGKVKRLDRDYKTTAEPIDTVIPIVVLVNNNTASSSEITAGALQDLDRAVIMGTRTYGKGLVQTTVDLPYNGKMKLTTHKYYIPSGRCIQAINYRHDRGGSTEHVPDSLSKVFHTLHGREVRDGGGIKPDLEIAPDTASNIQTYLMSVIDSTETVLDYIVSYVAKHPTIATPSAFELTDEDYEAFKQHVLKSGFKYDGVSEKILKELVKTAKFEGYYNDAKPEFDAIENKLKHNVAKDLDYNRDRIMQALASTIVSIYYYQRGTIEYTLKHDKQIKAAQKLLDNPAKYKEILASPNLIKGGENRVRK
ncbi:peptidase S41 [Prevotella sp. HMSC077E09]|uniref:S41 family peptidase n=1 Tax=Prevotella sp. HMSC077E09 TaxID=1739487 RepID=UPI0008A368C0|nr:MULTISPECIES: S41 family peptidase [unclassified Prevotella]OFO84004.1 peptidase S41 [Prevotella sp. HMSC077E08]OFP55066.1 peptidase S41 [Prevotella sp. HMSC077E09]